MFDELKELLDRDPFVPFRIVLTSGTVYEVTRPYQVAVGQSQLNYYYPGSNKWAGLRSNQVAAFEVMEAAR